MNNNIDNKKYLYLLKTKIASGFIDYKCDMSIVLHIPRFIILFFILQAPLLILISVWLVRNTDSVQLSMLLPLLIIFLFNVIIIVILSLLCIYFTRRKYFLFIIFGRYLFFLISIVISFFAAKYLLKIPDDTIEGWNIVISLLYYPFAMLLLSFVLSFKTIQNN